MAGGSSNTELRGRIERLEALVGLTDDADSLVDILSQIHGINTELVDLKNANENLQMEVVVLRKAVASTGLSSDNRNTKVRILEPKAFNGSKSAKELENFLWDMEQYFSTARVAETDKHKEKAETMGEWRNEEGRMVADVGNSKNKRNPSSDKGCWSCGGPHLARSCPSPGWVNAMTAGDVPPEEEERGGVVTALVNPLGLLLNNQISIVDTVGESSFKPE
ncbi:hypothetical protein RND71_021852 [Anisodus tanguticus]|uniref:Uncharacterized protein n=1 Tax=Anisodus tanguticus TaxID=243964 RepID=A0AAE1RXB2_9SOLA|nr:hypothetical protein RND71_021852 [Anisodus tanguticus]